MRLSPNCISGYLILLAFFCIPAFSQGNLISASTTVTLSSSSEVFTVQQPQPATRSITFQSVFVTCSGSSTCSFDIEINGSTATGTTSVTPTSVNPFTFTSQVQVFDSSNVGQGAVIGRYTLGGAGLINVDLSKIYWSANPTSGRNITVRTPSGQTETISITFQWFESN